MSVFSIPVKPRPGGPSGGGPPPEQGVFVTPETLVSFAGATLTVSMIWKVSGYLHAGWDNDPLVALIASGLVGVALYLISETDPARGRVTLRDRLIALFVAFINTLVLFIATVGAGTLTGGSGPAA